MQNIWRLRDEMVNSGHDEALRVLYFVLSRADLVRRGTFSASDANTDIYKSFQKLDKEETDYLIRKLPALADFSYYHGN
ncbi:hypothetical protein COOONC_11903 [Cooperia oncophora]